MHITYPSQSELGPVRVMLVAEEMETAIAWTVDPLMVSVHEYGVATKTFDATVRAQEPPDRFPIVLIQEPVWFVTLLDASQFTSAATT